MKPLVIVSGPSGAGKTTIADQVLTNRIITTTTRTKRPGEREGIDYYFLSKEAFETKKKNDEFIEYVEYAGNWYGVQKAELLLKTKESSAFTIVEYEGMKKLKEFYPNCITLFITTTFDDVKKQLLQRNEPMDVQEKRLETYHAEMQQATHYDFIIENPYGQLEQTLRHVQDILSTRLS